jgi:hypothetical protein
MIVDDERAVRISHLEIRQIAAVVGRDRLRRVGDHASSSSSRRVVVNAQQA